MANCHYPRLHFHPGRTWMARAAVVAGADGLIVEVHPSPETALCDGPQALYAAGFAAWVADVKRCVDLMGKIMAGPEAAVVAATS